MSILSPAEFVQRVIKVKQLYAEGIKSYKCVMVWWVILLVKIKSLPQKSKFCTLTPTRSQMSWVLIRFATVILFCHDTFW